VPVVLSEVFGDPNVGIFSFANEKLAILPAGVSSKKLASFKLALGVDAYGVGIADSRLVGIYVTGNSSSIIVPYITTEPELQLLEAAGVGVTVLPERRTALGNVVLCNDYGAVLDPRLKPPTVDAINKALDVPVSTATIGGLPHVGALATASNNGVLANPIIVESEMRKISQALGVPVEKGTVNSGVPYPKCGVVVNSRGAVVGSLTLGAELLTLSRVFQMD
jgi:translation initiation factor 6